jgi:hypothetical protein
VLGLESYRDASDMVGHGVCWGAPCTSTAISVAPDICDADCLACHGSECYGDPNKLAATLTAPSVKMDGFHSLDLRHIGRVMKAWRKSGDWTLRGLVGSEKRQALRSKQEILM